MKIFFNSSSVNFVKHLLLHVHGGPCFTAPTVAPVLGETYSSPLARFIFETFLAHESGRLTLFLGLAGVEELEEDAAGPGSTGISLLAIEKWRRKK